MTNPELPFEILSELAGQEEPTPATLADITAAADILDETDCREPSEDRLKALNVIKAAQDRVTPKVYVDFCLAGFLSSCSRCLVLICLRCYIGFPCRVSLNHPLRREK